MVFHCHNQLLRRPRQSIGQWRACTGVTNLTKFHIFAAEHKVNTYSENYITPMTVYRFGVDPPVKFMTSREIQEHQEALRIVDYYHERQYTIENAFLKNES